MVYHAGEPEVADGLKWQPIIAVCADGIYRSGYACNFYGSNALLVSKEIARAFGSPVLSNQPITQLFGENPSTYSILGYAGHNGIDYGTPVGTPIFAIGVGRVSQVGLDERGYGKYVRIDHPSGAISLYAHLSTQVVRQNEGTYEGELIGLSGNTGWVTGWNTGAHLHFELRMPPIEYGNGYGGRVDPLPYMDRIYSKMPNYFPGKIW